MNLTRRVLIGGAAACTAAALTTWALSSDALVLETPDGSRLEIERVAAVEINQRAAYTEVLLELDPDDAEALETLTRSNVGRPLEIRFRDETLADPVIAEPLLGGKLRLTLTDPVAAKRVEIVANALGP